MGKHVKSLILFSQWMSRKENSKTSEHLFCFKKDYSPFSSLIKWLAPTLHYNKPMSNKFALNLNFPTHTHTHTYNRYEIKLTGQ